MLLRPAFFDLRSSSPATGLPLCRSGVTTLTSERRPGEVGLTLTSAMTRLLLGFAGGEVDFLTRLQAPQRLLPFASAAHEAPEALLLPLHVRGLHALHLNFEHQLDRGLDLRLGRVRHHAEDHLIALLADERALLRDLRSDQHLHQTSGVEIPLGGES